MRIGFTYDLRDDYLAAGYDRLAVAEFDKQDTIDAIAEALIRLGHLVDRIGRLDQLVLRLAAGQSWDLVFNIAEGLRGASRESQIPALLEAYGIPVVFGDSLCLAVSLHKGHAKHIARSLGIPTPAFAVVEDAARDVDAVALSFPLFVKPVAEGTGKGITAKAVVRDKGELREACAGIIAQFRQPALVEEFLPGREFTVGLVGTGAKARVLGVMEVLLLDNADPGAYTFDNKDQYEDRVRYRLAGDPEAVAAGHVALAAYRALGCRDGGRVDIRSDGSGRPQLMEVNPLAGLNPDHSDLPILCRLLGIGYDELIGWIVASAAERVAEQLDML